jgi:hypothetical protein
MLYLQIMGCIEWKTHLPTTSSGRSKPGKRPTKSSANSTSERYEHMTKQIQEMTGLIVEEVLANKKIDGA